MGHKLPTTGLNKQDFSKRSWPFPQGSKKAIQQLQMSHTCSSRERYEGKMAGRKAEPVTPVLFTGKQKQKCSNRLPCPCPKEITGQNQEKQPYLAVKEAVKIWNSIQGLSGLDNLQFLAGCWTHSSLKTSTLLTRRAKQLLDVRFTTLTPLCFIYLFILYFLCWYNLLQENKMCFLSFDCSQIETEKE